MARRRMICPDIWESEDFSKLSHTTRLLFIGMFSHADDYGKGRSNADFLKSKVFPYDANVRTTDIQKSLNDIAAHMSVVVYLSCNGNTYYQLTNWKNWQSVNKPTPSKIPDYNPESDKRLFNGEYCSATVLVRDNYGSATVAVSSQKESKRKEKESKDVAVVKDTVININSEIQQQQKQVLLYFEKNIPGTISGAIAEGICSWLDTFPTEVIAKAIDESVVKNIRSYSYVNGILKSWAENNLTTLSLVEGHQQKWQDKKSIKASSSSNIFKQIEKIPDGNEIAEKILKSRKEKGIVNSDEDDLFG